MARKRAAEFDPPTEAEAQAHPELVIRAPKGGWMWKCHFCGRPAVHQGVSGRKVCKGHGGTTAAQRDPVVIQAAAERGVEVRGPGRPIKHGLYTRIPGYKVDELLERFYAAGVNPDDTEEDMLLLRAHLDEIRAMRPDLMEVHQNLGTLRDRLRSALQEDLPDEGEEMTIDRFLFAIERLDEVNALIVVFDKMATRALRMAKSIEDRHMKLIAMSKLRADTRLKNAAASQLDVFKLMVERMQAILHETLPVNQYESVMLRFARELAEVPKSAVRGVKAS